MLRDFGESTFTNGSLIIAGGQQGPCRSGAVMTPALQEGRIAAEISLTPGVSCSWINASKRGQRSAALGKVMHSGFVLRNAHVVAPAPPSRAAPSAQPAGRKVTSETAVAELAL
jgi:hypothetical protein